MTSGPPDGYAWHDVDPGRDVSLVAALMGASDRHDLGIDEPLESWIRETWGAPQYRGSAALLDGDGRAAAVGELDTVDARSHVDLFLSVHPEHRSAGLRRPLVAWAERRAVDLAGGPTTLLVTGAAEDPTFAPEVSDLGYRSVRTFWHMERDLPADDQPPNEPAGARIRPAVEGDDDEAVHAVLQEAFAGHFGFDPVSLEDWWTEQRTSLGYDPGLILVAEVDGRVVGSATGFRLDDVGWIGELGVLGSFRGRGLARSLLHRALAELHRRGAARARLNVDAENEAGATQLYRSVGMRPLRLFLIHERRVGEG